MSWILRIPVMQTGSMYAVWDEDRLMWGFAKEVATRFDSKETALSSAVASAIVKGREATDIEAVEV